MLLQQGNYEGLEKDKGIIVYCHTGGRSAVASEWLREDGFTAMNLIGGINAWAHEIDPEVDTY